MDQQGGKQTSKSGNKEVGEHMKMAEPREKSSQKKRRHNRDIGKEPIAGHHTKWFGTCLGEPKTCKK
jgi:hypothetical protein